MSLHVNLLDKYAPTSEEQSAYDKMLAFLKSDEENKFDRSNHKRHFTGSGLLVDMNEGKVLLNHHKFLDLWLCFGGHADGDHDLFEVAKRETIEESGIEDIKSVNSNIFDLDIHSIPERPAKNEPPHDHYDVLYLFETSINSTIKISHESTEVRWCDFNEAISLSGKDHRMGRILNKWRDLCGN